MSSCDRPKDKEIPCVIHGPLPIASCTDEDDIAVLNNFAAREPSKMERTYSALETLEK